MYTITFKTSDSVTDVTAAAGESLLEVARRAGIIIDAPCAGAGVCGKCRVRLLSGEVECEASTHIEERDSGEGWRLACVSRVSGEAEIFVPDSARDFLTGIRVSTDSDGDESRLFASLESAGVGLESRFSVLNPVFDEPTLDDPTPDMERFVRKLSAELGCEVRFTISALRLLPEMLRKHDFKVSVSCRNSGGIAEIFSVAAPSKARALGICIDIGTTSVAAMLCDLATGEVLIRGSCGNAQTIYGADVINRIIESTRDGGLERLRSAIVDKTLNPLVSEICAVSCVNVSEIISVSIAANTTMTHLLLGVQANALRMEPYVPAFFSLSNLTAGAIGLNVHTDAEVHFAPAVGSYVGGDISAGVLSSMLWNSDELTLFVDLGTNGELVFGNSDFMMTCACSAGPAFEGGEISCGMRATSGAIEACKIDTETMAPTFSVVGEVPPAGICGSGIIDIISELFRAKIINAKGSFIREGGRVVCDEHGIGRYILALAEGGNREVFISEVDITSFIRAKGAIYSAIETMLASLDMDSSMIGRVLVAGGIGSGIDMENAVRVGMLPDIPRDCFEYIGNTSLMGAYAALISEGAREKLSEIGGMMTYLELSAVPGYMDNFVAACFLPHTDSNRFPSVEI